MKILNVKNGKESIYVQAKDLIYMSTRYCDRMLPISITKIISKKIRFIGLAQKDMFIQFTDSDAVDFLKNQNYIIEFNDYRNLSVVQVETKYQELVKESSQVVNDMLSEENQKKIEIINKNCDINFMLNDITQIYNWKLGKTTLILPDFDL